MTIGEKKRVISEAIQRLAKNKGIYLRVNKIWANSLCLVIDLDYNVEGKEKRQRFGFVSK